MKTENDARHWIQHTLKGYPILIERMETGTHIPDLWFGGFQFGGWAELKCIVYPDGGMIKPGWRPGQLPWIKGAVAKGVHVLLLIFDDLDRLTAFSGKSIRLQYTPHEFSMLNCFCESLDYIAAIDFYRFLRQEHQEV